MLGLWYKTTWLGSRSCFGCFLSPLTRLGVSLKISSSIAFTNVDVTAFCHPLNFNCRQFILPTELFALPQAKCVYVFF